jgi:hypothetical protein
VDGGWDGTGVGCTDGGCDRCAWGVDQPWDEYVCQDGECGGWVSVYVGVEGGWEFTWVGCEFAELDDEHALGIE